MTWHFAISTPIFILNAGLSLWLAMMVWRHGRVAGSQAFALMLLASGFWSFTHLLEVSVDQVSAKIFWSKVQYLGSVIIGPSWFIFTCHYSRQLKRFPTRYIILLAIIPVITVLLTWTNEAHRLIWTEITPSVTNPDILKYEHGAWFWIAIAYNHSLVLAGTWSVFRVLRAAPKEYRSQPKALLIGALIPIVGNVLYLMGLSPVEGSDLTPFFLTITGITYLLAVLRFRLFDIRRVARAAIIDNMRDGMLIIDEKNHLVDVNPSALQLLGISKAIIGQDIHLSLAKYPVILEAIHHPYAHVTAVIGDTEPRHLDIQLSELYDSLGKPAGKLVVLRDVTERLTAEKTAFEAAVEQHRLQLLTRFIQDISHEFRTPLSVINTSLYFMEKTSDPERQKDRREIIQLQTKRLDSLISEMMMSVQLDSYSMIEPTPINLRDLLQTLTQDMMPIFREKQQRLILHPPEESVEVIGDVFMLQKALTNILQNASHYTPENGTITVTGRVDDVTSIEIHDTGIGMSAETKARIFERFFRADEAHSTPGFGLGLSIAQTIIEKHYGQIEVESSPDTGTTFIIRLPQVINEQTAIPALQFASN